MARMLVTATFLFSLGTLPLLSATTARAALGQQTLSPQNANTVAKPKLTPPAEMIVAEAEKTKAEAELKKVEIEAQKLDLERQKTNNAKEQFFYEFLFKVAVFLAGALFLIPIIVKLAPLFRKFGIPGFFEVELRETLSTTRELVRFVPEFTSPLATLKSVKPGQSPKIDAQAEYKYERCTWQLYKLFDEITDPNSLDTTAKEQVRKIIRNAYSFAASKEHRAKALDIILYLQKFTDRQLDSDEMYTIGTAYLQAALDPHMENTPITTTLLNAVPLLTDAYYGLKGTPDAVKVAYNLSLTMIYLGKYSEAISWANRCYEIDNDWGPWTSWNKACAQIKLKAEKDALDSLKSINRNYKFAEEEWQKLRDDIQKDEYFSELTTASDRTSQFLELCNQKRQVKDC